MFIQHQIQGKCKHDESMAKVPKHHREQEWEGNDREQCWDERQRSVTQKNNKKRYCSRLYSNVMSLEYRSLCSSEPFKIIDQSSTDF